MDRGPSEAEKKAQTEQVKKDVLRIKERNFKREHRYTVVKNTDALAALTDTEITILHILAAKVGNFREASGKEPLECVVVEHDWPEYEPTWGAIKARIVQDV